MMYIKFQQKSSGLLVGNRGNETDAWPILRTFLKVYTYYIFYFIFYSLIYSAAVADLASTERAPFTPFHTYIR
jgi:hypothetical protein